MKHTKAPTEPGQFRLVRAFTVDHNLRRLVQYCKGLQRTPEMQRWARTMRLRRRLSTRMKTAQACGPV